MRYCLALDLVDDQPLIEEYERHHRDVWPDVLAHIRSHGVSSMEIFRLGTRLTMIMETDDAVFNASAMGRAAVENDAVRRWEELMWTFQQPTLWTEEGTKWMPMTRIFDLAKQ
ncbi:L-rhamnose mutarotase [Caballeronia grimmiae]|uniref:L-fucose mutarotase n=1 Tax=Caballeronia grimmiae TaxID=1071679 RepID=A0A069NDA7_9BURK|nr:L-rhamnose mutarotase [Caballeronia grimmiae]KDR26393.1 hypothetical protein BG57_26455 [Caballeronia grimmiae]GGD70302.1 hypothetical protein GCM10010985_25990 [Caballeronia grimmiae]